MTPFDIDQKTEQAIRRITGSGARSDEATDEDYDSVTKAVQDKVEGPKILAVYPDLGPEAITPNPHSNSKVERFWDKAYPKEREKARERLGSPGLPAGKLVKVWRHMNALAGGLPPKLQPAAEKVAKAWATIDHLRNRDTGGSGSFPAGVNSSTSSAPPEREAKPQDELTLGVEAELRVIATHVTGPALNKLHQLPQEGLSTQQLEAQCALIKALEEYHESLIEYVTSQSSNRSEEITEAMSSEGAPAASGEGGMSNLPKRSASASPARSGKKIHR